MKKIILYTFISLFSSISFSQNLTQQNQSFKEYNVFGVSNEEIDSSLRAIAKDIEALNVDESVLLDLQNNKPEFIKFQLVHGAETLLVKMQRQDILANDLKIRNQNGEILKYAPGLYYRGIVNSDSKSLVVFNFFSKSVNGLISMPGDGNRNIGQLDNSNQYVIYTDSKMSVTQDFQCQVDELEQESDFLPQNEALSSAPSSVNCIRVFYELTNDIYVANSESVSSTMNWLTSVHNIVATLYSNESIPTSLSDVLIWQEEDPYVGGNLDKLQFFRSNRTAFDGDIGHLLDLPVSGGVAYLNTLCSSARYAFSGVSMSFSQLPTYSWTVNVIAHEMGHSLGSPHTHACFWNGDNTAIDACGPNNGYSEGCDNGPIPSNGGTIMSYCHLDSTGVNLANGFHPQVSAYLNSNIDSKSCLGTDCIESCVQTIAGVSASETGVNAFTINIDDVIANSWDYRVFELNTTPDPFTTTNSNSFVYNITTQPNTYYVVQVLSNCSNGSNGSFFNLLYLTDVDDWCSGATFTDDGGLGLNYQDNQYFEKTFYPDTFGKITLNINDFNLEEGFDFMTIYDGESTDAPVFADGDELSGSSLTTSFFQATNSVGAITVKFTSDNFVNAPGWDITVSCATLSNEEFSELYFSIFPNPVNSELNLKSLIPLDNLIIYDINGRIVFKKTLSEQQNTKIDLSQLNSGVYLMKVTKGASSIIKRIIKR
tara:strand:+ start:564 stop:2693 length:2130 start_codon:yes stop_codon:yes gene_type:complete